MARQSESEPHATASLCARSAAPAQPAPFLTLQLRCRLPDGCLLLAACCAVEDLGLNSEATSLPSSQLCQTLHINKAWEPVRALAGRGRDLLAGGENGWRRGETWWQGRKRVERGRSRADRQRGETSWRGGGRKVTQLHRHHAVGNSVLRQHSKLAHSCTGSFRSECYGRLVSFLPLRLSLSACCCWLLLPL